MDHPYLHPGLAGSADFLCPTGLTSGGVIINTSFANTLVGNTKRTFGVYSLGIESDAAKASARLPRADPDGELAGAAKRETSLA